MVAIRVVNVSPKGQINTVSSISVSLTTPTVGNKLYMLLSTFTSPSPLVATISDNKGNTWSALRCETSVNQDQVAVYEADVTSTGAGFQVTITWPSACGGGAFVVVEVEGMASGNSFDAKSGATATGGVASITVPALTARAQAYELAFAQIACDTATSASNLNSPKGWNWLATENDSPTFLCVGIAYQIVEYGGPIDAITWTHANPGTGSDAAMISTFKGSGSPPANPPSSAAIKSLRRGIGAANSGR